MASKEYWEGLYRYTALLYLYEFYGAAIIGLLAGLWKPNRRMSIKIRLTNAASAFFLVIVVAALIRWFSPAAADSAGPAINQSSNGANSPNIIGDGNVIHINRESK